MNIWIFVIIAIVAFAGAFYLEWRHRRKEKGIKASKEINN